MGGELGISLLLGFFGFLTDIRVVFFASLLPLGSGASPVVPASSTISFRCDNCLSLRGFGERVMLDLSLRMDPFDQYPGKTVDTCP